MLPKKQFIFSKKQGTMLIKQDSELGTILIVIECLIGDIPYNTKKKGQDVHVHQYSFLLNYKKFIFKQKQAKVSKCNK